MADLLAPALIEAYDSASRIQVGAALSVTELNKEQQRQISTLESMEQGEVAAQSFSRALGEAMILVNQTIAVARQTIEAPRQRWGLFSTSLVSSESKMSAYRLMQAVPLLSASSHGRGISSPVVVYVLRFLELSLWMAMRLAVMIGYTMVCRSKRCVEGD